MDDFTIPDNIDQTVADLLVSGREFSVGPRRFRVRGVDRGHMSRVNGEVIPLIRQQRDGRWLLGLYEDPEQDASSPLLVALELERLR